MSKINYEKISSDDTIYPDNPKYEFPKGIETIDHKTKYWFKIIKSNFESFEHHKNSSIFSLYGHSSEDKTMKMPRGAVPMSERYNNMQEDVMNGCRYRIENYSDAERGGWNIMEKILGDYRVEIIDNEVIEERLKILNKFTDLLNEDEFLTSIDPDTNEEAKTAVDPLTSKERGIEYLFPYGIENTDELHYTVLELPKSERESIKEKDIENFVRRVLLEKVISDEKPANDKILGHLLGNYEELRPHAVLIKKLIKEQVEAINNWKILEEIDRTLKNYLTSSEEAWLEASSQPYIKLDKAKQRVFEIIDNEISKYQNIAKEKQSKTKGTYEEVYKTVSIRKLLKRIKDKTRKNILIKNKPPSGGKQGGSNWPKGRGGKYILRFSQKPLDILTKTTGRAWGSKEWSCENWDGQWLMGPQSDFHYGNCVVWIFKDGEVEENQQIGRALIRWGDSYDELGNKLGRKDLGVEQQLYPKDAAWGLNMFKAIAQILNDNGYFKYNQLNTPYSYRGYSDYIGRGGCPIQYQKPRFKGKTIELGENELMSMASNVKLAYATAGWLVSNGNEMVKRTLSQNPVIWLYENAIRRLINTSLDLEDGRGLIYDLITSDYADFNFLNVVVDTISLYDYDYDKWGNADNFINVILNHSNANERTHKSIIDNHPGFKELGTGENLGTVEELIYFNVLNRANRIDTPLNRNITLAPKNILDLSVDKLVNNELLNDIETIDNRWNYSRNYNYVEADYENSEDRKFYKKYREKLYAINNLLLAPNLSNKSYCKLLKLFESIMNECEKSIQDGLFTFRALSPRLIENVRFQISISSCFAFKNSKSWGWKWDDYIDSTGLDSEWKINIMPVKIKNRYFKEERLSYDAIPILIKICPELFHKKHDSWEGKNYLGEESVISQGLLNIYDNLRNKEIADYLYATNIRYDLNTLFLLRKPIPETIELIPGEQLYEMNEEPQEWKETVKESKSLLTDKYKLQIFKIYLDSSNETILNNLELIKYDFMPDDNIFRLCGLWGTLLRNEEPYGFINSLFNSKSSPTKCKLIGFDLISTWITKEEDFNLFERILYKAIFGKYYEYKNKKHIFTDLPKIDEKSGWDLYIKEEEMKNEIDISLLSICANGLENKTLGLSDNPNLPQTLQLKLILPEYDLETREKITSYGQTKWSQLSEKYGGDYKYYRKSIVEKIASNPGATGPTLRYILKAYYKLHGNKILKKVAQNPNSWLVGAKEYQLLLDRYPVDLLNNENQKAETLKDIFWNKLIPMVEKTITKDPEELFQKNICDLGGNTEKLGKGDIITRALNKSNTDARVLDYIEGGLVNKKKRKGDDAIPYYKFWRGGNYTSNALHGEVNSPLADVRSLPRSSMIRSIIGNVPPPIGHDDYKRINNKLKDAGYLSSWPYIKLEHYYEENNSIGQSEIPPVMLDPHFIITFEGGCFSKVIVEKWSIIGLPSGVRERLLLPNITNLNTKEEAQSIINDIWLESWSINGIVFGFNTEEEAQLYIVDNIWGGASEDELKELNKLIRKTKNCDNIPKLQISKIFADSGATNKSIIEVFEIHQVIQNKEFQLSETAELLSGKFGIPVSELQTLPSMDIEQGYTYIGRKKKQGGKWVSFSFNTIEYLNAIGYKLQTWTKNLVLCFTPITQDKEIPPWRLEMSNAKLKTMVRNYLQNKLTDIGEYEKIYDWVNERMNKPLKSSKFTSPLGEYNFAIKSLFSLIDNNKLWTKEMINYSLPSLLNPARNCWIMNFMNIKPTSKILEITMLDNQDALFDMGYANISIRDVKSIQEWLIGHFSKDLPISYIYELITWPGASEQVKGHARNIRNNRLDEFIDYQRELQDDMLEGAAEEYLIFDSEERVHSLNDLLIKYCEIKHPKDLNKREALMQNIIYGKEYISIEDMVNIVKEIQI